MNKKQFIKELSKRTGLSEYTIDEIYNVSSELTIETLILGEEVELPKIGKFNINRKNATNLFGDFNKKTCTYPTFKMNNRIKERVKNAYN